VRFVQAEQRMELTPYLIKESMTAQVE